MPVLFEKLNIEYQEYSFTIEADFERVVMKLSNQIFGPDSVYFNVKKRVKGKDIISIPDGYVIDFADPNNPRLFVVENEIVSHDPFKHIGNQMLRFVVSFEDARAEIWDILMLEIQGNKDVLKLLEQAVKKSSFRNVDDFLNKAVYSEFSGVVVIDEVLPELTRVLEKINANISVLELRTFQAEDGSFCYHYDTLYEEEKAGVANISGPQTYKTPEERKHYIERRAQCDTVIVPAQEDGFNRVFLKENRWHAIRIGAAMKNKIKYIASYQVAPISAVTYIAEVKEIRPYKDTGKYEVIFTGPAKEITPIKLREIKYKPQGPVYSKYEKLMKAKFLEDALGE